MLTVQIKNEGESAYQHEVYGDTIIVERHFSRSGSSAFKLKAKSGRMISTRRGDLEEICDYFALQIDNPMNVLTQDMARQFLNSSSPQDKYKFFMKGTQLEHLDCDYLIVEQTLDTIETELYKKHEDFKVFEDQARKAEELFRMSSQQDAIEEKLHQLRNQMAWVQVQREENKLAVQDAALRKLDEDLARLQEKATGISEAFDQTGQHVDNACQTLEAARESVLPLQEEKASTRAEYDRHRTEQVSLVVGPTDHYLRSMLTQGQTDERNIVGELRDAKSRVDTLEKDIATEKQRLEAADGGQNAERRQDLERRQEAVDQAKLDHERLEAELSSLERKERDAREVIPEAQNLLKEHRDKVKAAEDKLNTLRHDRGQQMTAYPSSMPRLLSLIQREGGFRERPVGPIGNHVTLLEPSWSSILEKQFGATLDSFVVTSKDDQNKLTALMQSRANPQRGHQLAAGLAEAA